MIDPGLIAPEHLLSEALRGARTVAILGCGSELRGDDAAGEEVAERLLELEAGKGSNTLVCCGGSAPENFTGEIKKFRPDLLLIIDAADMGLPPGAVAMIKSDEIGGASSSTHSLALNIMSGYLERETGCRVSVLGIQPASMEFGAALTPNVRQTVDEIVSALDNLLQTIH